jgi:SHS2 domain-containing protein
MGLASRESFDHQIALLNEKVVGRTSGGWTLTFRFLPDVAIADVAFLARASSLNGLFESSAEALTEVMVDRRSLRPVVEREISLSAEDLDRLLYDFLTELIILKDVDSLLFKVFKVEIDEKGPRLSCLMKGEQIDRVRHKLRNDVKAVTMHMFGIKKERKGWSATVVLDI